MDTDSIIGTMLERIHSTGKPGTAHCEECRTRNGLSYGGGVVILKVGDTDTLIDDEDFEAIHVCERYHRPGKVVARVCDLAWKASKEKYATYIAATVRMWCPIQNTRVTAYVDIQRLVMNAPVTLVVDHRNGETLDNRKSNLTLTTQSQNCGKNAKRGSGNSKYRGVFKQHGKYRAQIGVSNRVVHIGTYKSELEAAHAYDDVAKRCFERPSLNFPSEANA